MSIEVSFEAKNDEEAIAIRDNTSVVNKNAEIMNSDIWCLTEPTHDDENDEQVEERIIFNDREI